MAMQRTCDRRQAGHIFLPMWLSLWCLPSFIQWYVIGNNPLLLKSCQKVQLCLFSLGIFHHVPGFLCGSLFFFFFSSAIYLRRLTIQQALWPWLVILPLLSSSVERINGIRWCVRTLPTYIYIPEGYILKDNVTITRYILVISMY